MPAREVIIIGGGAAGIFAAIHAAEAGARVTVLEKSPKPLTKVEISGGGRCNVTHACQDPRELVLSYPRGGRELRGPFSRWHVKHTIDWCAAHGIVLKTEDDGRMFPVTDSSQSIVDSFALAHATVRAFLWAGNPIRPHGFVFSSGFRFQLSAFFSGVGQSLSILI